MMTAPKHIVSKLEKIQTAFHEKTPKINHETLCNYI